MEVGRNIRSAVWERMGCNYARGKKLSDFFLSLNLRHFFIFNAIQQTSNRIDKMMSDEAYELYNSKSEIVLSL